MSPVRDPDTGAPRRPLLWGGLLALLVIAADQASKVWIAFELMNPPRTIEITGFFNLVLVYNTGVSFGLFSNGSPWSVYALAGLALLVCVALLWWLRRVETRAQMLALGLIVGGAFGNVVDRLVYGAVVDFLDVHAFGHHWPAFNVADSAICVGAAFLVYDAFFARKTRDT
ncbi:lipoprotein signal peptidase [Phaeovibrio sulfidiphilus]|uniref:Lipoprotein signal peptidase n=1 Tax=Phaeovibrio sulfidiphilus TaxID=1220600 RepID=A0A8J6YXC5_9PROT|nr:signal peptidase II [Phaeovibrio sulfidiphilus]MBE1236413.1 lipoprotein signal peptidase [Phaeovibrio sulfidiphilus]